MDRTIDYTPLFSPVTSTEVAEFQRATLAARPNASAEQVQRIIGVVLGVVMALVIGVSMLTPAAFALAALSIRSMP